MAVAVLALVFVQTLTLLIVLLVGTALLRRLHRLAGLLYDDSPVSGHAPR